MQVFGGASLCTMKLHLAADHLPDQVRVGGPAYLALEFWIERLVQEYKRFIKYRSTAFPEHLFIGDQNLLRACSFIRILGAGGGVKTLDELVAEIKALWRRDRPGTEAGDRKLPSPETLLGAARDPTDSDVAKILPPFPRAVNHQLKGLPSLLHSTPGLEAEDRWPAFPDLHPVPRRSAIYKELGLAAGATRPGVEGTQVVLRKHLRGRVRSGHDVGSAQNRRQRGGGDRWALVFYEETRGGSHVKVPYLASVQFYAEAYLVTANGRGCPDRLSANGDADPSSPLALAVVDLYTCEAVTGPALRPGNAALEIPADLYACRRPRPGSASHWKEWVVLVDQLVCQLQPGGEHAGRSLFATVYKGVK